MRTICILALTGLAIMAGSLSEAKTIRVKDLSPTFWSELNQGKVTDLTVEFRSGDEIPITIAAEGDFLETRNPGTTSVFVKRDFWLRAEGQKIEMSLDGQNFKAVGDLVSGSLTAGGGSPENGGPIQSINVLFSAFLKK